MMHELNCQGEPWAVGFEQTDGRWRVTFTRRRNGRSYSRLLRDGEKVWLVEVGMSLELCQLLHELLRPDFDATGRGAGGKFVGWRGFCDVCGEDRFLVDIIPQVGVSRDPGVVTLGIGGFTVCGCGRAPSFD